MERRDQRQFVANEVVGGVSVDGRVREDNLAAAFGPDACKDRRE
jgi:hypothetical protein